MCSTRPWKVRKAVRALLSKGEHYLLGHPLPFPEANPRDLGQGLELFPAGDALITRSGVNEYIDSPN